MTNKSDTSVTWKHVFVKISNFFKSHNIMKDTFVPKLTWHLCGGENVLFLPKLINDMFYFVCVLSWEKCKGNEEILWFTFIEIHLTLIKVAVIMICHLSNYKSLHVFCNKISINVSLIYWSTGRFLCTCKFITVFVFAQRATVKKHRWLKAHTTK